MLGGYFGQQPFGGAFTALEEVPPDPAEIQALIVHLLNSVPALGTATRTRGASFSLLALQAVMTRTNSSPALTLSRPTTNATNINWLVSP